MIKSLPSVVISLIFTVSLIITVNCQNETHASTPAAPATSATTPATSATTPATSASSTTSAIPESFRIGGLFEFGSENVEQAFQHALDATNEGRVLGANRLKGKVEHLELADSFQASQTVCDLLKNGVLAIYGPQSLESTSHVQSMAASMEVPHLEARIDHKPPGNHSVNLMPTPVVFSKAFRDLVVKKNWTSFAIVYDSDAAWMRLQEFLKDDSLRDVKMIIRRAAGDNDQQVLTEIKSKGFRNIMTDLSLRNGRFGAFLKVAQDNDMLNAYYNYVVTSLDLEMADSTPVPASLTSFSLIQKPKTTYSVATALTYDAIALFAQALADLLQKHPLERHNLSCAGLSETWPYGLKIRQQMLNTKIEGMTGEIKFDESGIRSDFKLRIQENIGTNGGMQTVGLWTPTDGIRFNEGYAQNLTAKAARSLRGKRLVVVTAVKGPPMEEYLKELLNLLQEDLGFNSTLQVLDMYGRRRDDGKWEGTVGRLVDGTADLALNDLTVTPEREAVIDVIPFMTTGIAIVLKKSIVDPKTGNLTTNITSAEDLLNQDAIKYGTVKGGAIERFFMTVNHVTYAAMYAKMTESNPSVFVKSGSEGFERVKAGGFAMITESTAAEFFVNNNCDVAQVGGLLNKQMFALATQKGSPYTALIADSVRKLQESGKLKELKERLWKGSKVCV